MYFCRKQKLLFMEWYYIVILIFLGCLAVADLMVGVSNDAVNFLGPAVGSRAGSFRIIMIVAAIGVVIGAVFSGGMMEVARKGIFHPEQFMFSEIILIFLAVMIADVLLLDFFNTFGLPTSTTVSLVFGLLGSAVAASVIKIMNLGGSMSDLSTYINSDKALAIISGILISVVVAFFAGMMIQYITRLLFSFNYQKKVKITSGLFGGVALTAILLFIVLKGLGDSSIVTKADKAWILDHTWSIALISFAVLSVLLQILHMLFKLNVFKLVVFAGTFGLALSFAGNDLVNFIGAPMAGFKSFQLWQSSGTAPESFSMEALTGEVPADAYLLLIAGLIMVATIFLSRKARTVVKTTLELSRQDEGDERWGSSYMARAAVQGAVSFQKGMAKILPKSFMSFLSRRFDNTQASMDETQPVSFDLIRASVNLVVASILIAAATSLKLPLSTTYVTFMVAMGTSLADGAWGRESAVFRITGVLTVISGWFFTAFIAFVVAATVLTILHFTGMFGVIGMVLLAAFLMYRSRVLHKNRENESVEAEDAEESIPANSMELSEQLNRKVKDVISSIPRIYSETILALEDEDRKKLKKLAKEVNQSNKQTKKYKNQSLKLVKHLNKDLLDSGSHAVKVFDYVRETAYCLNYITNPSFTHVNNVHNPIPDERFRELKKIKDQIVELYADLIDKVNHEKLSHVEIKPRIEQILMYLEKERKVQLVTIKESDMNTRTTMLYLSIMHETKNMLLHLDNFIQAYEEFSKNLPKTS